MAPMAIQLSNHDSVAVALCNMACGTIVRIGSKEILLKSDIAQGHKFSVKAVSKSENIIKYGFPIGKASNNIEVGDWVHSHNLSTGLESNSSGVNYEAPNLLPNSKSLEQFMGFARPEGGYGIRNEIWIMPTVGCVTALSAKLANHFNAMKYDNIDGVYSLGHQFGCSQLGEDLGATRDIIGALACHPNCGGVLIIGLGCENNRLSKLIDIIPEKFRYKLKFFEAQKVGDEFEIGKTQLEELIAIANTQTRTKAPIQDLIIGVKCGGSDGLSGLTANPLIGRISARFANSGAKVIITEIPEMFGAEHILYQNCKNEGVFSKLEKLIDKFKNYFIVHGEKIYENPSPGNKDGGITTLEEKSIGAVQKGGGAIICDVLKYAERVQKSGLNVLEAPGNDAISSTALAASGAHIILFSTGRGTPLGFVVPTLKISSNSELASNKPHWIDFDAGSIIEDNDFDKAENQLFTKIIDIANGAKAKNEISEVRDFAIWKNGVTL